MKSVYVTSSALLSLGDSQNENYDVSVQFVQSLFNKTVHTYCSMIELILASKVYEDEKKYSRVLSLVEHFQAGGIQMLQEPSGSLDMIFQFMMDKKGVGEKGVYYSYVATLLQAHGINNIFTYDKSFENYNVIVWPKDC